MLRILGAVLLCLPALALSQTTSAARDPQALSLLASCSAAMGTPTPVLQLYAEGTVTYLFSNSTAPIVMKEVGLDRTRNEITLNGVQQIYVVNAGHGFSVNGSHR